MARRQPHAGAGRRWRPRWIILLVLGLLLDLVWGLWVWQQVIGTPETRAHPIATLATLDVHALLWSPVEAQTIFFGDHDGLLKSTDGGQNWQPTSLTNADVISLAAAPTMPMRMYAAGDGVFSRSDDVGVTWTAPAGALQGVDIRGFAQSPADPNRLYALVDKRGLLASADGGTTWTSVSAVPSHATVTSRWRPSMGRRR